MVFDVLQVKVEVRMTRKRADRLCDHEFIVWDGNVGQPKHVRFLDDDASQVEVQFVFHNDSGSGIQAFTVPRTYLFDVVRIVPA